MNVFYVKRFTGAFYVMLAGALSFYAVMPIQADTLPNGDVVAMTYWQTSVKDGATNIATSTNVSCDIVIDSYAISNAVDQELTTPCFVNSYIAVNLGETSRSTAAKVIIKLTPVTKIPQEGSKWDNWETENFYNWFPTKFSVKGSNDLTNFTTIETFDTSTLSDGTTRTSTSEEPYSTTPVDVSAYKYVCIVGESEGVLKSWACTYFAVAELAVYDTADENVDAKEYLALTKRGGTEPQLFTKLLTSTSADDNTTATVKLSTNAPQTINSYNGDETPADVALSKLVDNDESTYFQSTWWVGKENDNAYNAAPHENHYIQVDLGEKRNNFALYMRPRNINNMPNLMPANFIVYATNSADSAACTETGWESSWTKIIECSDTRGQNYFSGTMWLSTAYRYLRIVNLSSYPDNEYVQRYGFAWNDTNHNTWNTWADQSETDEPIHYPYFCLSELQICEPKNVELKKVNGLYYEVLTINDTTKIATYTQQLPSTTTGSVSIPDSIDTDGDGNVDTEVTEISNTAFTNSSVTSVSIPATITSIGTGTFIGTKSLTSITVAKDNTTYKSEADALLETVSPLYEGLTLLVYPEANSATTFTLPDDIVAIDQLAFFQAHNLQTIDLSQTNGGTGTATGSLKTIAACAFEEAEALTEITIPKTVESVGMSAFESCPKLATAKLYCDTIGNYCFRGDSALTTLNFYYDADDNNYTTDHGNTKTIGEKTFYNCTSLKEIDIPRSVESIGAGAFANCSSVKTVKNHSTESAVAKNCYQYMTKLKTVYLYSPNTTSIGEGAFQTNSEVLADVYIYAKQVPDVSNSNNDPYFKAKIHCFADLVSQYTNNTSYTSTISALTYPMTIGHGMSFNGKTYNNVSPYSSGVFEWPKELSKGMTAYYATGDTTKKDGTTYLSVTKLDLGEGNILPAAVAVILKAASGSEGNNENKQLYSTSSVKKPSYNILQGDSVEHTVARKHLISSTDSTYYGMTYDSTTGEAVFRQVTYINDVVIPAGKIYLKATSIKSNSNAKMIVVGFDEDDETTGIREITDDETGKPTIVYDLQGRRVASPMHGIYIINGKIIYVK